MKLSSTSIHSIPGLRASNSYLIETDSGTLELIDAGMPGSSKKIIEYIKTIGKDPKSLSLIVLTHSDIDHSGSAAELKEAVPNAKIAIHEGDAPRLAGQKKLKEVKGAAGIAMGIMGSFIKFHPVNPDVVLKDGDIVGDLKTIWTPGHTEGSACFLDERNRALFVGDTLRTSSNDKIEFAPASMSVDVQQVKESVRNKLAGLDFDLLLPGHGPPILSEGSKQLGLLIASQQTSHA